MIVGDKVRFVNILEVWDRRKSQDFSGTFEVVKITNRILVYKKGFDGHMDSGRSPICSNRECWYVDESAIALIRSSSLVKVDDLK
jgi:hypothetical protein